MREDLLSTSPELLDAFRKGRRDAMRAVFEAYEPLVRCIAVQGFDGFGGYRSAADVDDAVASVFAAAFEPGTRQRYDPATPYFSFLGGISRNTIRGLLRKSGKEVPLPVDEHADHLAGPESWEPETLNELCERSVMAQRFHQHLADPFLQAVACETLANGLSEQAAAEQLNVTRHQIRKALETIRKRIHSFLKKEGLE